jgi:hypothetical protein
MLNQQRISNKISVINQQRISNEISVADLHIQQLIIRY